MQILHNAILLALPWVPRAVVRRIAGRYIAGESLADLLRVAQALEEQGLLSTVDLLGENVTVLEEARRAADEYLRLVDELARRELRSQVSLKLTLLGLRVSPATAQELVREITLHAARHHLSVCLDMEDASTTEATIGIYRRLREETDAIGIAIQAYLHRSQGDLASLLPLKPTIRVCKGIYNEPASVALKDKRAIQESYLRLVGLLLDGGGFPAIATHDPFLVDKCQKIIHERGLGPDSHEFQMLLGVGERIRPRILKSGSRLRLYCPYGPDWYAYSLRRLRENPKMAGYVLRSVLSPRLLKRRRVGV